MARWFNLLFLTVIPAVVFSEQEEHLLRDKRIMSKLFILSLCLVALHITTADDCKQGVWLAGSYDGQGIGVVLADSYQECDKLCAADKKCKFFTFSTKMGCQKVSQNFRDSPAKGGMNKIFTSGEVGCAHCRQDMWFAGFYSGKGIGQKVNVADYKACDAICVKDSHCKSFTYAASSKGCQLVSVSLKETTEKTGSRGAAEGFISGHAGCSKVGVWKWEG